MADELDKLSSEDIKLFAKTTSELKDLLAYEEKLIKKILEGEQKIGKTRIAYLEQYFDTYSAYLDKLIARESNELLDAFYILERQALNHYKANVTANSGSDSTKGVDNRKTDSAKKSDDTYKDDSYKEQNNKRSNFVSKSARDQMGDAYDNEDNRMLEPGQAESLADALAELLKKSKNGFIDLSRLIDENFIEQTKREDLKKAREEGHYKKQYSYTERILSAEERLAALRESSSGELLNITNDLRLQKQAEASEASATAETLISGMKAELSYLGGDGTGQEETVDEAIATRLKTIQANETAKSIQELKDRMEKELTYKTAEAIAKHGTNKADLDKELKKINETIAKRYENFEKQAQQLTAERIQKEKEEREKANAAEKKKRLVAGEDALNALTGKGHTVEERMEALKKLTKGEDSAQTAKNIGGLAVKLISNLAKQLENQIDDIGSYKGAIDTRMQGAKHDTSFFGSYWDKIVDNMTSVGAINPFFKQKDFANNIKALVDKGIAYEVEQRAFLITIKDKIASTFNATDATLLRLIRIQEQDSTAARLGMESALNSFLNEMYETSEYLSDVAGSVRNSLQEMEALMSSTSAAEVEYQVQKWLGSLYSVGMSESAVQGISDTLGKIAAGQIEGLTGEGAGNLLIMAANDAGIPITDILTRGINADETNKLLEAAVNYLAELAEASGGNQIVQQQLANVFGVKASDLKAVTNLKSSPGVISSIFGDSLSYGNMLDQLFAMAGTMGARTSMAEVMTNIWENGQYTLAGSMASNPAAYLIYKMATVLDNTVGGIPIPALSVMGSGVDLETTVADLMRVASLSTGIFGSLGPMISGLGNSFSGRKMLEELGIGSGEAKLKITARNPYNRKNLLDSPEKTVGESGYVGNSSASDIKNSTILEAENSKKQQMIEAKEEAETNQIDVLNTTVLKIYELLNDVASGNSYFRVKIDNYGLTKAGNASNTLGGVGALENLSEGTSGFSSNNGNASTGSNSMPSGSVSNINRSLDFGGWTTTV